MFDFIHLLKMQKLVKQVSEPCPSADSDSAPVLKDASDAGGIRRLSAEQRKLLGSAGGGQPALGTGETGAAPWRPGSVAPCYGSYGQAINFFSF